MCVWCWLVAVFEITLTGALQIPVLSYAGGGLIQGQDRWLCLHVSLRWPSYDRILLCCQHTHTHHFFCMYQSYCLSICTISCFSFFLSVVYFIREVLFIDYQCISHDLSKLPMRLWTFCDLTVVPKIGPYWIHPLFLKSKSTSSVLQVLF